MSDSDGATDPERDAHLLELGRAIAEWANVEEQLYHIVQSVLGCAAQRAAIVFYRTPTLESRIQLADDLLQTVFPQTSDNPGSQPHPGYAVWTQIQKDLRKETPIRNRLAHQPVELRAAVWQHKSGEISIGPLKIVTATSLAEAMKKGIGDEPLDFEHIKSHIVRVSAFPGRLLQFRSGPLGTRLQEHS
jgi:hypothetical protein